MQKVTTLLFFILWILFLPRIAFSYPEMVRHGYVNCISCHVSPNGGGVLTQYGRELSREVLSHKGVEGESQFAYGVVKPPAWLNLGGDFRNLVLFKDTPTVREGRVILMQADVEAIASYMKFLVGGTVGYREIPNVESTTNNFISRRHYINYRPTDELSFRAGRFQPSYGINTPDHAIVTKRGLNWDQGSETYNLEAAWIGEKYNAFLTGIFGRPDNETLNREKGVAINTAVAFLDRIKTGLSYFYGSNNIQKRQVYGPWAIFGITPYFYFLTELDFQNTTPVSSTPSQSGLVNYNKVDYEFFQGFHAFSTLEFQQTDFSKPDALSKFLGLGLQYFPRPHFELSFTVQRQFIANVNDPTNVAFLLFHFYP